MSEGTKLRFQIQTLKMSIERWTDEINKLKERLHEYETEKAQLVDKLEALEKKYALKSDETN